MLCIVPRDIHIVSCHLLPMPLHRERNTCLQDSKMCTFLLTVWYEHLKKTQFRYRNTALTRHWPGFQPNSIDWGGGGAGTKSARCRDRDWKRASDGSAIELKLSSTLQHQLSRLPPVRLARSVKAAIVIVDGESTHRHWPTWRLEGVRVAIALRKCFFVCDLTWVNVWKLWKFR